MAEGARTSAMVRITPPLKHFPTNLNATIEPSQEKVTTTVATNDQPHTPTPKIVIEGNPFWVRRDMSSGAVELIKWLAILAMVIDHIDYLLLGRQSYVMFAIGRVAMPLFFLLFAYHMARPTVTEQTHIKTMIRLLAFAFVAQIPYVGGSGENHTGQLNILFSLLLLTSLFYLSDQARALVGARRWNAAIAMVLVLGASSIVEYGWVGLAIGLAARASFRSPTPASLMSLAAALSALFFINGNQFALLALPIFIAVSHMPPPIRRSPWFLYYAFYPAHLALLWAMQPLFR